MEEKERESEEGTEGAEFCSGVGGPWESKDWSAEEDEVEVVVVVDAVEVEETERRLRASVGGEGPTGL